MSVVEPDPIERRVVALSGLMCADGGEPITGDNGGSGYPKGDGERRILDAAEDAAARVWSPNAERAGELRLRSSEEMLPVRTRDWAAENPLPWDRATEYAEGREEFELKEPIS